MMLPKTVNALLVCVLVIAALSLATTHDRANWVLEELVVLFAIPFVWHYSSKIGLTPVLVIAAVLEMLVITHGAHATYEHARVGEWLARLIGIERNPWDRVGHLFQGVVPTLVTREVLRRHIRLRPGPLVAFLSLSVAMAISAMYEIIEMLLGVFGPPSTASFVDTNGDLLDPQWDMTMALIGALTAAVVLAWWQDRQLESDAGFRNRPDRSTLKVPEGSIP
jgi:putative membrane protein